MFTLLPAEIQETCGWLLGDTSNRDVFGKEHLFGITNWYVAFFVNWQIKKNIAAGLASVEEKRKANEKWLLGIGYNRTNRSSFVFAEQREKYCDNWGNFASFLWEHADAENKSVARKEW